MLVALSFDASALSRKDQAAVDALTQRMQAAEARYRDAAVRAANADPEAQKQGDAALEDMEDVIAACGKQRGCSVPTMLAALSDCSSRTSTAAWTTPTRRSWTNRPAAARPARPRC